MIMAGPPTMALRRIRAPHKQRLLQPYTISICMCDHTAGSCLHDDAIDADVDDSDGSVAALKDVG